MEECLSTSSNHPHPHPSNRKQEYIARKLVQWGKVKEFKEYLGDCRKKPNAYFGYAVSIPIPVTECVVGRIGSFPHDWIGPWRSIDWSTDSMKTSIIPLAPSTHPCRAEIEQFVEDARLSRDEDE